MVTPEQIKSYIEEGLEDASVEVDGDGRHFNAVIICPDFAGKSTLEQHRMVYAVLGERMKEEIHALSMRTSAS
jgi:acid stress-induced BolA-like protein IbaG/YrbA